jgi:hypothetical protein
MEHLLIYSWNPTWARKIESTVKRKDSLSISNSDNNLVIVYVHICSQDGLPLWSSANLRLYTPWIFNLKINKVISNANPYTIFKAAQQKCKNPVTKHLISFIIWNCENRDDKSYDTLSNRCYFYFNVENLKSKTDFRLKNISWPKGLNRRLHIVYKLNNHKNNV